MTTTKMTPVQAATALGMDTFTLARHLRTEAADQLRSLAGDIERGGEAPRGDVDEDEFNGRVEAAWRLVESAKPCDADWQSR